ncbi:2Fe-2S iron-sulfur cluster-binding protein [Rubripirellula reticaptiva]|uniref:Flavohemoprotein n=1 Tax=Rubripirellula reticaptiva TaxID=2528013 RepID=A0A5C6FF09_9BACT|nr:2Fe-2S iron-sulfur cluster-binding protein [Rubripirellula reticaptiva]TWU58171.1 Flavohemoprotein [Rubripirellula reticaptiva]
MTGILGIVLIIPIIAYLVFAEFISRREERRYRTDIISDLPTLSSSTPSSSESTQSSQTTASNPNNLSWKGWRDMVVDAIQDESPDCRSFSLRPADGELMPRFKGGQSISVRCKPSEEADSPKPVVRCYSLSSGPGEPRYRITVKRVPDGRMSRQLHDTIQAGDVIQIQSPRGHFHINPDYPERPLHLIAAGIGITPMLSMLLQSLEETPNREVHLYYQLRDQTNAPFLKPLRYLGNTLAQTGKFQLHVWFSRPIEDADSLTDSALDRITTGRISAAQIIERTGSGEGDYRICGPSVFMELMATELIQHGIDEASVQYESFGGKAKGPGAIAVKNSGASETDELKITFTQSSCHTTWNDPSVSLLDVADDAGVNVDASCRAGQCGACVHRLIKGNVRYDEQPECDFEDGEVVMCVARPETDVEIKA